MGFLVSKQKPEPEPEPEPEAEPAPEPEPEPAPEEEEQLGEDEEEPPDEWVTYFFLSNLIHLEEQYLSENRKCQLSVVHGADLSK